jgi:hydroxymethylpyrimidine pyrophosphatase-like HAD family hydrolase
MGVAPSETAVIGDGANDVAMFARSGLSIAMGNAAAEVQQAADFVTAPNNRDGFAAAMERLVLGRGSAERPEHRLQAAAKERR